MLKKLLLNADLIYGIPHELSHVFAGWMIGVEVILDLKSRQVLVPKDIPDWKHIVIIVAPVALALFIIALSFSVPIIHGLTRSTAQAALWGSTYGLIILISCIATDLRDLVEYFKTGKIA